MNTQEIFVVENDGQMIVNWESLELICSANKGGKAFVDSLRKDLESGCDLISLEVTSGITVRSIVRDKSVVTISIWDRFVTEDYYTYYHLAPSDFDKIIASYGGAIQ
jgi:hypothetical protein